MIEIPPHTCWKSWDQKKKSVPLNSHVSFLVQMENDPTALENILSLLAKSEWTPTIQSSDCTPWHLAKLKLNFTGKLHAWVFIMSLFETAKLGSNQYVFL